MFKNIGSGDKTIIISAVTGAAKAAYILDVLVFLSFINPKAMGEFIQEVSGLFPNQEVFAREVPSFDAFEMKRLGLLLRNWIERKWLFQGCGQSCALHILLCMP